MEKTLLILLTTHCSLLTSGSGLLHAQSIACGISHSLALCNTNIPKSCGANIYGQLGDGTGVDQSTPVQVSVVTGITAVSGGGYHSLFLKNDGTAWACGNNSNSQLGDGTTIQRTTPVQVSGLTGITSVAGGGWHSLFVKNDGTAWACGDNLYGQLGDGTAPADKSTPVQVSSLSGITAVAAGEYHSFFLKNNGTVWACGRNDYGQLGDGTIVDRSTPVLVSSLTGITDVAAGFWHSLFVKNDGTAWACGSNGFGELGDGTAGGSACFCGDPNCCKSTPVQVSGLTGITAVEAGQYHSLFVKNNGTAWACGRNLYGGLGDGTGVDQSTPVLVSSLTGITDVAAGGWHSLFLKNDGTAWACGLNSNFGQLGDGTNTNRFTPVQMLMGCTVVLPIELLSFRASCHIGQSEIFVRWQTASEQNNDYFTIERSQSSVVSGQLQNTNNGQPATNNWQIIGTVKGSGNSSTIRSYEFVDDTPALKGEAQYSALQGGGHIYYRLKQTDYDGKYEYFGPISVKCESTDEWNFILQSTPAQKELLATLRIPENAQVQIDICDLQGRKIISNQHSAIKGSNLLQFDLKNVSSGLYFIKVHNNEKQLTKKFVNLDI